MRLYGAAALCAEVFHLFERAAEQKRASATISACLLIWLPMRSTLQPSQVPGLRLAEPSIFSKPYAFAVEAQWIP
jgi:hypothetical protein